jgi:hypothetical protein
MMGRLFVLSGLMVLSCFAVVTRGMRMMLCRLLMVLGCFLGHSGVSSLVARNTPAGNNGTSASEKSFLYDNHFFLLRRSALVGVEKVGWSQRRSSTSALERIADSSRTSREVR